MRARKAIVLVATASLAATIATATASGSGTRWRQYTVPTGGFSIALPATWVDVSAGTPKVLALLKKDPAYAAVAAGLQSSGGIKLIAADAAGSGSYMDIAVVNVGSISLKTTSAEAAAAFHGLPGVRGAVSTRDLRLPSGPAVMLSATIRMGGKTNALTEFLIVHDGLGYALAFTSKAGNRSKDAPVFLESAQSFRVLPPVDLSRLVLGAAEVGPGYRRKTFVGGTQFIGRVTLDLCGGTFPSEALRTGRMQVAYLHAGTSVGVSNEVVTYVPGGGQEALGEVAKVAASCKQKPVTRGSGKNRITFSAAPLADPRLAPDAVAVVITQSGYVNGKKVVTSGVAIYQVVGNTLSGIYTFAYRPALRRSAVTIGLHAAELSWKKLSALQLAS